MGGGRNEEQRKYLYDMNEFQSYADAQGFPIFKTFFDCHNVICRK